MGAEAVLSCLRTIERCASAARDRARGELAILSLSLDVATDLRVVAATLTGGPVKAQPNLTTPESERVGGILHWTDGTPRLLYERYHPLVRQRFSIAHELGHFFLHARDGRSLPLRCVAAAAGDDTCDTAALVRHREEEADAFAAAFLLPADNVVADLERFGRCVAFLAERYIVAPATMRRRLDTLEQLAR